MEQGWRFVGAGTIPNLTDTDATQGEQGLEVTVAPSAIGVQTLYQPVDLSTLAGHTLTLNLDYSFFEAWFDSATSNVALIVSISTIEGAPIQTTPIFIENGGVGTPFTFGNFQFDISGAAGQYVNIAFQWAQGGTGDELTGELFVIDDVRIVVQP